MSFSSSSSSSTSVSSFHSSSSSTATLPPNYSLASVSRPTIRRLLRKRYHPYLHSSASVHELASPMSFDDRIEAYDQFNHHSMTFVGYLRQYNSKRRLLTDLKDEILDLERKMIETHRRMVCDGRNLAALVPDISSSEEDEDDDLVNLGDSDSEDVNLTAANARASTPPLTVDLTSIPNNNEATRTHAIPGIAERVVDATGTETLVGCVGRTVYAVANIAFTNGIRSRFYLKMVNCTLCDDVFRELYKCSNYDCVARMCGLCLIRLESVPRKCPFCNSKYELPPLSERINRVHDIHRATSPPAVAPPRARSPEF